MNDTLSTIQWQRLQQLFALTIGADPKTGAALVASTRAEDPRVADALVALLDADRNWHERTGDVVVELSRAAQVSSVGTRLGAYCLTSEIGRGGMGVVYLGERVDGQLQHQVAIKVLHTHNLDPNTRARFQREREILANFDHPGIARLLDAGESASGEPYFVMEYLRGLAITGHADAERFSIRERLNLFLQVCDAVQYAHAKLILHRDIKPSNVMVDATGVPKLIDFGIAKALLLESPQSTESTLTQQRFFSPINAAPEQIRGSALAVTCDVYQLGVLLYELLCGTPVFELAGLSPGEIEHRICDTPPFPPSTMALRANIVTCTSRRQLNAKSLSRHLGGDLDAITLKALRKEPEHRYASVEQMAGDIRRHLTQLPILGRRGTTRYRVGRFVTRHWRVLGLVSAVCVGVAVFTTALLRQVHETASERDRAVAENRRAESVTHFLLDLFRAGDPASSLRPETTVAVAMERGRALLDTSLVAEPRTQAAVASTLAEVYTSLADFDTAEHLSAQALGVLESNVLGDSSELATQLEQYAAILLRNDRSVDALAAATRALALRQSASVPGLAHSARARMLVLQAQAHTDPTACNKLEELAAQFDRDDKSLRDVYVEVQIAAARCGSISVLRAERLERDVRKAMAIYTEGDRADMVPLIRLKSELLRLLYRQDKLDEMDVIQKQLLSAQEAIFGVDSWSTSKTLTGIGLSAYWRGDYSAARQWLTRSLELLIKVHKNRSHSDVAQALYNLGLVYDYGNLDRQQALDLYRRAIEMGKATLGDQHPSVGQFNVEYGLLLLRGSDYAKAETALREAVAVLPPQHEGSARARISLATALVHRQALAEALEQLDLAEPKIPGLTEDDPELQAEVADLRRKLAGLSQR